MNAPFIVAFLKSALDVLLDLCLEAGSRGTETHAYLLGERSRREIIITTVLRAGRPVELAAMTQPDYGASAVAMQPYLDRGLLLLGEAHRHPGLIGPSTGDRLMLLAIPDLFRHYLCVVVATFPDDRKPVVTAHSVVDGRIVEHDVRIITSPYPALLPASVGEERVLHFGAGSGAALVLLQVAKFNVGLLTIADDDVFELRNLERTIVDKTALGKNKAVVLTRFLRPRTSARVRALPLHVGHDTMDQVDAQVRRHSLVLNGTGDPIGSVRISQSCVRNRTVCIHAGAFARAAGGFVFLQTPDGPCYECLYDFDLASAPDDRETMETLTRQYGFNEQELHAQTGLWADVNTIAAVAAKVTQDYLKYGLDPRRPNLYLIDNHHLSIKQLTVQRRPDCTTCQEAP
jgi:molybdopterin/thiamine biosynthesis adenylyltransferase